MYIFYPSRFRFTGLDPKLAAHFGSNCKRRLRAFGEFSLCEKVLFQVIKCPFDATPALVPVRGTLALHTLRESASDTQAPALPPRILGPANELVNVTRGGCDRCPRRIDVLCSWRRTLTRRETLMK